MNKNNKSLRTHFLSLLFCAFNPATMLLSVNAQNTKEDTAQPDNKIANAQSDKESNVPSEKTISTMDSILVKGATFIEKGTRSAMKLDVDVMDTPYSVSSYSSEFMDSIEASNIADIFKYMTGLQKAGTSAQDITFRGFKTGGNDRNALMVDGLPGLSGRFSSPPSISVEHVDVVRGPASVLYGQAQPGGFVNLNTKKPTAQRKSEVQLKGSTYWSNASRFGDDNGYEIGVDFTGRLNSNNNWLYRLIAQKHDNDTFRDFAYNKGLFISPSITWNATDATSATLLLEYREYENAYDKYLTAPNRDISRVAAITTHYQQPGDYQEEKGHSQTLLIRHGFSSSSTLNFSIRHASSIDRAKAFDAVAVRPNMEYISRRAVRNKNKRESIFFDSNFEIPFSTGNISHQALIGINGGINSTDLNRLQFFNGPATGANSLDISIRDPIYTGYPRHEDLPTVTPNAPRTLTHRRTESEALGIYISNLITFSEKWKFNFGLRKTYDSQSIEELRISGIPSFDKSSNKVLPQAGLLFQPSQTWTFYTSYSTSYVPAAANVQDINGRNPFDPEESKQFEAGIKISSMDDRIQATLAAFDIKKEKSLTSFTCPIGTCSEQIGAQRSKGMEFEINARPVENWQLTFGYARADAYVSESRDLAQLNAQLPNSARDTLQFWSRYDFSGGALDGLGAGIGVSYAGERKGNLPSSTDARVMVLPSYKIVDLAIYYKRNNSITTLKIGNLLDERYFESTGLLAETQVQPGLPRNISLSTRIQF